MSEELLSNDRRVEKHLTPPGFEPLTTLFITICTADCAIWLLLLLWCNRLYISNFGVRIKSLKNEERKHEKVTSKVKECSRRKAQNGQAKNLHKKTTFAIIAMNFVHEQLNRTFLSSKNKVGAIILWIKAFSAVSTERSPRDEWNS